VGSVLAGPDGPPETAVVGRMTRKLRSAALRSLWSHVVYFVNLLLSWPLNKRVQRTRRPSLCSGRSLRSLGSPLTRHPLGRRRNRRV
jgi:hypothetical protein